MAPKKSSETRANSSKPKRIATKSQVNDRFSPKSNRVAIEEVIQNLVGLGRLEQVDVGLLNLARSAAQLVDDLPTPAAIKEYLNVLSRLAVLGKEADNDFALLIDELRTEVRDPEK